MTVSSTQQKVSYTGNGSTTAFTIPFYFLDNTHINVIQVVAATGAVVDPATGVTITGAGVSSGGTATFSVAPASGDTIIIRREVPLTQATHYVDGDRFSAASIEAALDQSVMVDQQVAETLGRVPTLPVQTTGVDLTLPTPTAGTALGWDAAGTALTNLVIPGVTATYVASFNGRSGAVVPTTGDYTFAQIASTPTTIAGYGITDALVNTFNGRSGAVVPTTGDYSFSQLSGSATAAQINTALTAPGPIGTSTAGVVNGTTVKAYTYFDGPGTNLTGTAASLTAGTATVANGLKSATTTVVVSAAAAPSARQVLTATSSTAADWEYPGYDIGGGCTGKPAASAVILRFPAVRAFTLPTNLTGSQGKAGTAATASATFNIAKNGVNIGTMAFAASGTVPTWTNTATSFAAGDILTVTAPSSQDATLADIGFVLMGTIA